MKPFCADAKCVKCHGEDISTVHYPDAKTEDCYDRNHGILDVVEARIARIAPAAEPGTRSIGVTLVLDNLVKGAAGQAVQNANLVLGVPEDRGLSTIGVAP